MNALRCAAAFAAIAFAVVAASPRAMAGPPSAVFSFTVNSSGNIDFPVSDLTTPLLAGSQSYSYTMKVRTSASTGYVQLNAPTMTGTAGNSIPFGAFHAVCTAQSDSAGMFGSLGTVQLAASAVNCASLAPSTTSTITFTVTLYLDDTPDATAFTADTYANGTMTLTVNMP